MLRFFLLCVAVSLFARSETADFYREEICFDFAWRFYFGDISSDGLSPEDAVPPAAMPNYNDSAWEIIDAPHDAMIGGEYDENAGEEHGYLPTNVSWYRKHFSLPDEWEGKAIWLYFDGVFRATYIWLNGEPLTYHDSGYTSFSVRLDNASGIAKDNVIALRTEPEGSTGSWYEGAGLYRHVRLIATSRQHIVFDGVFSLSNINGTIYPHDENDPSKGFYADSATLTVSAEIGNGETGGGAVDVNVEFRLYDGDTVLASESTAVSVDPGSIQSGNTTLSLMKPELWSLSRPYLYRLETLVLGFGGVLDSVNTTIGLRRNHYDPNHGYTLNNQHVVWRGFSSPSNFAGIGTGLPDRIHLFRVQMLRSIGGNTWRSANSPPTPALLDVLDRVGVLAWVENRQFGNNSAWLDDRRATVRRDRNHPCIAAWSLCSGDSCNEPDPEGKNIANEFKSVILGEDPQSTIGASVDGSYGFNNGLTGIVNVLGLYFPDGNRFDSLHKQFRFPYKPALASECCECPTFRGEEVLNTDPDHPRLTNFNADCNNETNIAAMSRNWVVGEIAWTLFDYLGDSKPFLWPQISSASGSFDWAGFPKASAFWYQAWWLYNSMTDRRRVPPLMDPRQTLKKTLDENFMVHIVERWQPDNNRPTRTIHVYTNAPSVELFANNTSQGLRNVSFLGWAEWTNVTFVPGNLTAVAMNGDQPVAQHTVETVGNQASLILYVDVPSEATGTGTALLLDGQDVGIVRATIVDGQGRVVQSGKNVSFSVTSGPGRIIGVGNGDPTNHQPNRASWRGGYQGVVRAMVQVTEDQASPLWHRRRLAQIDKDCGRRTRIDENEHVVDSDQIIVEATASGFGTATAVIPVSTDTSKHGIKQMLENLYG